MNDDRLTVRWTEDGPVADGPAPERLTITDQLAAGTDDGVITRDGDLVTFHLLSGDVTYRVVNHSRVYEITMLERVDA